MKPTIPRLPLVAALACATIILGTGCQTASPLHQQISQGNQTAALQTLKGTKDVDQTDIHGITPLIYASRSGNAEVARALLDRGAKVNFTTKTGTTALTAASSAGHSQLVSLLLERGAQVNGHVASHDTALTAAAAAGKASTVALLLQNKADVGAKGVNGRTALIAAAANGHGEVCSLLLGAGAEMSATDKSGYDALLAAIQNRHLDSIRILTSAGAMLASKGDDLDKTFHKGVHEAIKGEVHLAAGRTNEAMSAVRTASPLLVTARDGLAKRAEELTKKASNKDASSAFWGTVLQGVAQGLASAGTSYNNYSGYQSSAQITALRNSSTPAQYSANYNTLMSNYRPAPVTYGNPTVPSVATQPSSGADRLRAESRAARDRSFFCRELLASISRDLKP